MPSITSVDNEQLRFVIDFSAFVSLVGFTADFMSQNPSNSYIATTKTAVIILTPWQPFTIVNLKLFGRICQSCNKCRNNSSY